MKLMEALLFSLLAIIQAQQLVLPADIDQAVATEYTFDNGTFLENLYVRANGDVITSALTCGPGKKPALYNVLQFVHGVFLVHEFEEPDRPLGIGEIAIDQLVVVTANVSLESFSVWPGSAKLWRVNMTAYMLSEPPIVTLITTLPDVGWPNSVFSRVTEPSLAILSDSINGLIWKIDCTTGAYSVAVDIPELKPVPGYPLGVNGIAATGNLIYFTNTGQGIVGSIGFAPNSTAINSATILASNLTQPDELFLVGYNVYVVGDNTFWQIEDGKATVLAGGHDHLALEGVTAAKFGKLEKPDSDVIYFSTNGGVAEPVGGVVTGGKILSFNIALGLAGLPDPDAS